MNVVCRKHASDAFFRAFLRLLTASSPFLKFGGVAVISSPISIPLSGSQGLQCRCRTTDGATWRYIPVRPANQTQFKFTSNGLNG